MKKLLALLFSIELLTQVHGQNGLRHCVDITFRRMDSLSKLDKNPWTEWEKCVIGKAIPSFSARTIDGKTITNADLKGKVVVINFWAIECPPCIAELPALNRLKKEYEGKDVLFLAPAYHTRARLDTAFFSKYRFDFSVLPEAIPMAEDFGESGFPTTFIVDQNGVVKAAWTGGPTDEKAETEAYEHAKPIIDELLKRVIKN